MNQDCDASTIYRHFVRGKGTIMVDDGVVNVVYPRRAHNPILRAVPWDKLDSSVRTPNRQKKRAWRWRQRG